MPKLIYAEPDDEITNLVDRLRSEKDEKSLVFVLPAASRVLQSGLNARLLMQYSNSLGKSTAIVSPDQRTQAIGVETGFKVFPSLARYEIDAPVVAPNGGEAAPQTPVLAAVPATAPAPAPPRRTAPARAPAPQPPAPVAPHHPSRPALSRPERGFGPYLAGGAIGVFILLLAALIALPTAEVDITVSARAVQTTASVCGNTSGSCSGQSLSVKTTELTAQEQSQQQQFNATGTKTIPAVQATGQVVFTNNSVFGVQFQSGTEVYTDSGIKFRTQGATGVLQPGSSSPPVPVTAEQGGVSGNVPAGAIDHISAGQYQSYGFSVSNPNATGGGVDAQTKTIISQQDLDNAANTLGNPLKDKVKQELQQQAGSQKILTDTESITPTPTYDHHAGDEAQNFNAQVQVKGRATAVNEGDIRAQLRVALQHQVPAGYVITDDPLKTDYQLVQHDDNGNDVFTGNVSGFMASAVDIDHLRQQLAGKSAAAATAIIENSVETSNPVIKQVPPFLPWLPWISGRITIRRLVQNIQPG
jgi:hypothetical protein